MKVLIAFLALNRDLQSFMELEALFQALVESFMKDVKHVSQAKQVNITSKYNLYNMKPSQLKYILCNDFHSMLQQDLCLST